MHIQDLALPDLSYQHIYLSPHLDDAALSCGGRILTQRAAGEQVLVITLCSASPPAEGPFSDLAKQFHADWGLTPDQAVAARLKEDQLAMSRLGCDNYLAGMLDAIYRNPTAYTSRESLFNQPVADDPLFSSLRSFIGELRERFPQATIYSPLGIGHHVDHLITFATVVATLGPAARFYEDIHYVLTPGALEERQSEIAEPLASETLAIDGVLEQKIAAIHAYASQLGELFGGIDAMPGAITAYSAKVRPPHAAYGERLWRLA